MSKTGKCLCGEVEIKITADHHDVGTCHCEMCRRWSSGPFMVLHVGKDLEISGAENITTYASSEWAERAFCNKCGSNLYYKLTGNGDHMLSAGLFDDTDDMVLTNQIFIDEKPGYYELANDTPKMTGAEVFAMYAPNDDAGE